MMIRLPTLLLASCLSIFISSESTLPQSLKQLQAKRDSLNRLADSLTTQVKEIRNTAAQLNAKIQYEKARSHFASDERYIATSKPAKLRAAPEPLAKSILEIPVGDSVRFLECHRSYWKIEYKGMVGFVGDVYFPAGEQKNSLIELGKKEAAVRHDKEEALKESQRRKQEQRRRQLAKQRRREQELRERERLKEKRASLIRRHGKATAERIMAGRIWLGMTDEMARASWRKPDEINRTVGRFGVHEQWVYPGTYLYFENGKLTSWQD